MITATSTSPVTDTATAALAPGAQPPAAPPAEAAPEASAPAEAKAEQETKATSSKVVAMPTQSIAKIRAESREQGKRQMQKELDEEARALGFASYAEMKAAAVLNAAKKAQAEKAPKPAEAAAPTAEVVAAPGADVPMTKKARAELDAALEKVRESNRRAAQEERRRKAAERRASDLEVESELKIAAIRAGVVDPDYAVHYARSVLKSKTPEELRNFDENSFFVELRKTKPYLFGAVEMPATTSNEAPAPANPRVDASASSQGTPGLPDVRKMTREEYAAYMRKHNRTIPGMF